MRSITVKAALLMIMMGLGLAACDKGPAEQFGEEVDEAAESVEESGEKLDDEVQDAADEYSQ